jgi:hypothetical protein
MDWGLFFQAASVGVAVVGIVIAGFWRLWAMINGVRDEATRDVQAAVKLATDTREELHLHRLHVSETYITRASLREVMEPVMDAISGVRDQITGMSGRIDRLMERPATNASTRTS